MRAADLLIEDTDALLAALKRAFEYKATPTIGRSHGIHAEPTTFGVKLAGFYVAETARQAQRQKWPPAPFLARSAPSPISIPK